MSSASPLPLFVGVDTTALYPHHLHQPRFLHRRRNLSLISRLPTSSGRRKHGAAPPLVAPLLCSKNDAAEAVHLGDAPELLSDPNGCEKNNGGQAANGFSSKELMLKLKRYGIAGVLSYGLLNTVYYLTAFLSVWLYFAPAPGRMGYGAAVQRFFKIMAVVWAGSQVTKIFRAGGALALAPFVDRGLSWFTAKFKFQSEGKAFAAIVCLCLGVALIIFFGLTLLWA